MPGMRTENRMERRRRVSKEEGQIARIKAILGASEEIIRDGTRIRVYELNQTQREELIERTTT